MTIGRVLVGLLLASLSASSASATAGELLELGRGLIDEGRRGEAISLYEDALLLAETDPAMTSETIGAVSNELAGLYREDGRFDEALELYRQALAKSAEAEPADSMNVATVRYNLGRLLHDMGRLEEAVEAYERAVPIWTDALGEHHPVTQTAMGDLADALEALSRHGEAVRLRRLLLSRPAETGPRHEIESPPATASAGAYWVQIGSRPSVREARQLLKELRADHEELLGRLPARIYQADLGERGTWYRVQVGRFEAEDPARELCDRLSARGQECLVLKGD